MRKRQIIIGHMRRPKVITADDRIRLKELLKLILVGTSYENKDSEIDQMMKSTPRVACLKFIESIVAVHEFPNHDVISKFMDVYYQDINSRMTLICNVDKEFHFNNFIIHRSYAMKHCLILGEMITNSFNQALGSRKELKINHTCGIVMKDGKREFTFYYSDNGKGVTESIDLRGTNKFGWDIAISITDFLGVEPIFALEEGGFGFLFKHFLENKN